MHDYLRSIGFSKVKTKEELNRLLNFTEDEPEIDFITDDGIKPVLGEKSKYFAKRMGITVRGEYDSEGRFCRDHYFPFFEGESVTMSEEISMEKHSDKDSYAGICDNPNVGVAVIFHLLNMIDYVEHIHHVRRDEAQRQVILSALSVSGHIIFPIMKSEADIRKGKMETKIRNKKIADARNGDQEAIESLTLEDLDLYTMASKRARHEDVLSIVETYFMPYGIACDQYSVLGNILDVEQTMNQYTGEKIYILRLECNSLLFDVCINADDLLGIPEAGRRFKGNIWLQGNVKFQNVNM